MSPHYKERDREAKITKTLGIETLAAVVRLQREDAERHFTVEPTAVLNERTQQSAIL